MSFPQPHTLANMWHGTGERKPPFWGGNLHAHRPPEMDVSRWIKDQADQWCEVQRGLQQP